MTRSIFPFGAIAALTIFSLSSAQEPTSVTEGQVSDSAAPASNFIDLRKRGSGKLKQAISSFLKENDLVVGENPNGLWIETGTATIQGVGGSATWGDNRKMAFLEAQLNAQAALVRSLALKSQVIALRELTSDDSVLQPSFREPRGFKDRMAAKLEQLSEAKLDQALADMGEPVAPTESLTSKRELFRKALQKPSLKNAFEEVSGFAVVTTIEAIDEDNPGKVSIGVVIARRPNSLGWISIVKNGGATGVPRGEPGRPLSERIVEDPSWLYDKFGVRVVYDETGQLNIIAYGQSSPNVQRGMSDDVIDEKISAAEAYAESDAEDALTMFLDQSLAWRRRVDEGLATRRNEIRSTVDGVDVTREDSIVDNIKRLNEKAVAWSKAYIVGARRYHSWQGNHPDYGNPIVGSVIVWSPASAAAAARFNSNTSPEAGSVFKPRTPVPGVRRSQGEDIPKGRGNQSEDSAPTSAVEPASCDGTEAVGLGSDREAAVIQALENAVRQACGVAIASSTETERSSENSIVEVRINEACSEMRSTFKSSALLNRDISVRTKGLVESYRVLSEEIDPTSRKVRISICAQIPEFDPRNPRPGAKPTLIVVKPTCRQSTFDVFGSQVSAQDVARSLETELARDIFKTRAFTLLERERLAAILGEQAFIASDLTALREKAKLGILSGGDLVFISEVEDLVAAQDERVIKLTGNRVVRRYGSAKVNWRVVSVGTGEVIDQDTVSIPLDDAGFRQMTTNFPAAPVQSAFMATASSRIAPALAARVAPLRVAQVVGTTVFLNRGNDTLRSGQTFDVYRQGDEMTDPNTGASLGRTESHIGVVKVDRCETDFSTAVVVSGSLGQGDAGSVCRARG